MGLNKNHEVEDFNGVKCAIVEKNVSKERAGFLKKLLEYNHYQVEVITSAPPKEKTAVSSAVISEKIVASAKETTTETATAAPEPAPLTFNVGVTALMFNPINAVFGRLLKTSGGHIVTLAYWQQKENISHDEVPYYESK